MHHWFVFLCFSLAAAQLSFHLFFSFTIAATDRHLSILVPSNLTTAKLTEAASRNSSQLVRSPGATDYNEQAAPVSRTICTLDSREAIMPCRTPRFSLKHFVSLYPPLPDRLSKSLSIVMGTWPPGANGAMPPLLSAASSACFFLASKRFALAAG